MLEYAASGRHYWTASDFRSQAQSTAGNEERLIQELNELTGTEIVNGQFKDLEVLIVEARQYQHRDARIVIPWVFGFTEEARVAKRDSKLETACSSPARGEGAFWEVVETSTLEPEWKTRFMILWREQAESPAVNTDGL